MSGSQLWLLCTAVLVTVQAAPANLAINVLSSGAWSLSLAGTPWFASPATAPSICVSGAQTALSLTSTTSASGTDTFGPWTGTALTWTAPSNPSAIVVHTFQVYTTQSSIVVMTASFPRGLDTNGCPGGPKGISIPFPAINTTAARAPSLGFLQWRDEALKTSATSLGLASLGANALDAGPIVSYEMSGPVPSRASISWSSLTAHKILPHVTTASTHTYAQGLSAAIPSVPANWNYSVVFVGTTGGPTSATYAHGALLQSYYQTRRLPSVTLDKVGYYTDDGAYYYVWEAFGIAARPWPAEKGLIEVVNNLTMSGVPVSYLQLDDWWYTGESMQAQRP